MSQENVDLKTIGASVIDAFNARDIPTLLGFFDRDAVLEEHPDFRPDPASYHGWLEIAGYWESYDRAWDDLRVEIEDMRVAGDKLLGSTRFVAHGKLSGAAIETPVYLVGTFRGDKLTHLDLHLDRATALEAAGLRE